MIYDTELKFQQQRNLIVKQRAKPVPELYCQGTEFASKVVLVQKVELIWDVGV